MQMDIFENFTTQHQVENFIDGLSREKCEFSCMWKNCMNTIRLMETKKYNIYEQKNLN